MWPFKSKEKVEDLQNTPAINFKHLMRDVMQNGVYEIRKQTTEIEAISDIITIMMESRSKLVQERAALVEIVNKQRNVLGLDEVDEEGIALSEQPAEDETYALEP